MDPKTTRISDIMTSQVLTLRASMTLRQAMTALEARGISGAPVTDENGACVGVFSLSNVARAGNFFSSEANRERPEQAPGVGSVDEETVKGWMSADVKSVPATTSVEAAAKLMARGGIHRLLVIDEGVVAGIVSSMDIVRWTAGLARSERPEGAAYDTALEI